MKLIDGQIIADELLGEIFERGQASRLWEQQLEIGALTYKDIEFADGYDLALDNLYRQIRDAEEIKAIPIEWIEKWLDKTTGTRDGEDISQLPEQLKFAIEMINLMEMEWEKENADTN